MESKLRLGLQAVLNGWIGHETRLVEASWTRETVLITVYTDGHLEDELAEDFVVEVDKCLTPSIDPKWSGSPVIEVEFVRLDDPLPINVKGIVVFVRRGVPIVA